MNKQIMRKHYEATPKETLIDILIASRQEIERLINIINELEKYIISQMQEQETLKETKSPSYIFCKLQELKRK